MFELDEGSMAESDLFREGVALHAGGLATPITPSAAPCIHTPCPELTT